MSVFKGHDDLSLNRYYYSFYSFSQDDPNTIKSFVYDQNQTLVSSKDISFNSRNISDMLSFLENSQSNPYALGKSNDEFLNMDITFAGLYKKALTETQQQSLMTTINKTYKNVYSNIITTYKVKVVSTTTTNLVDFNVLNFGGLDQNGFATILSSNDFSIDYDYFNYSDADEDSINYFSLPGVNEPIRTDVSYGSAISFLSPGSEVSYIQKTYGTSDISANTVIQIYYGGNPNLDPVYVYHKTSSQSGFTQIDSTQDTYKHFVYTINPGDTIRLEETFSGVILFAIVLSKQTTVNSIKYLIDDVEQPNLEALLTGNYIFDQSDPSNDGHLLKFRSSLGDSTSYTTNVIHQGTPGTPDSYTLIDVTQSTPDLEYYCQVHTESMYGEFKTPTDLPYYTVKVETNIVGDPVFAIQSPGQSAYVLQPDLSFNIGDLVYFYVGDDSMADISLVFGPTVDDTASMVGSPYYVKMGDIIRLDLTSGYTGDPLVYFEDSSAGMGYLPASGGGGADTNVVPTLLWYNFDTSTVTGDNITNVATGSTLGHASMTRSSIVTDVSKTGTGSLLCVRDAGQMQYVTLPSLNLPNEFTMCFWHKMTPDSGFATNIYLLYFMGVNTDATYNSQYAIDIEVNKGNFEIILNHSAGVVTRYNYGAYPNDNAWHHLMFIKSATEFKVYIDNSIRKDPIKDVNMGTFSTSTYNSHYISGRSDLLNDTANYHMGGHTDDYRFYSIALDDTQRDTVYNYAPSQIATYTVDVSNGVFRLDSGDGNGFEDKPAVAFNSNTTYIFDQSHVSNTGNTLVIGTAFNDPASIVSSGLTIMGTPGQAGAYTKYVSDGSTVHYFSYQTENMGLAPPNITDDLYVHYDFEFPLYDPNGTERTDGLTGGNVNVRTYNKAYDSSTNSDVSYNGYLAKFGNGSAHLDSTIKKIGSSSLKVSESPVRSDNAWKLNNDQGYSICFWMKEDSASGPLFGMDNVNGDPFFYIEYNSVLTVKNNGTTLTYNISALTMTDWNHIAFTISPDGPDITWKLYINGSLVNTKTDGNYLVPQKIRPESEYPVDLIYLVDIGAKPGSSNYKGYFDDFRFYKTEISQAQVSAVYSYTG